MNEKADRNNLTFAQKLQFGNFMLAEYTASGLDNSEFAPYASQKLGFPISQAQVQHARADLDLPPNRPQRGNGSGTKMSRIAALEKRVEALEKRIEVYLTGSTK